MKKYILLSAILLQAACVHDPANNSAIYAPVASPSFEERRVIAEETCEAQYSQGRQNYLAAVEARIGDGGYPDATRAPLDAFRAEINAAYNAVVANCKTHMNCLEFQNYEEAKCYMSAGDRKEAERRFADLAEDLRRIEQRKTARSTAKPKPSVTVNNNNVVTQKNDQSQSIEAQTGPRIEDQDVLIMCGDARNLLKERCRRPCDNCR